MLWSCLLCELVLVELELEVRLYWTTFFFFAVLVERECEVRLYCITEGDGVQRSYVAVSVEHEYEYEHEGSPVRCDSTQ